MPKKPKKPPNYPLQIPPELRAEAQAVADANRRFLHGQILVFIEEGVRRWKKEQMEASGE